MDNFLRDITGLAMAMIGVATIAVLVKNSTGAAQVISAASTGFSTALNTAMGGKI